MPALAALIGSVALRGVPADPLQPDDAIRESLVDNVKRVAFLQALRGRAWRCLQPPIDLCPLPSHPIPRRWRTWLPLIRIYVANVERPDWRASASRTDPHGCSRWWREEEQAKEAVVWNTVERALLLGEGGRHATPRHARAAHMPTTLFLLLEFLFLRGWRRQQQGDVEGEEVEGGALIEERVPQRIAVAAVALSL